jgi:hypothetical protein
MEMIQNIHIYTPSQEAMPDNPDQAIPKTGENNNSPSPPKGQTIANP